jgi:hypothetical protein
MEATVMAAAEKAGTGSAQMVLAIVCAALVVCVIYIFRCWREAEKKYTDSLISQIQNGRERNMVDQLNAQVLKAIAEKQPGAGS